MKNELIPIGYQEINGETVQTVNARDLHAFLGIGKVFGAWIQDRIKHYKFVNNQDFIVVFSNPGKNTKGGRPSKDYHLTLDMAKEVAMAENNAKGREARRYFIECEKRLLGILRQQQPAIQPPSITREFLRDMDPDEVVKQFKMIHSMLSMSPGLDANQAYLGAVIRFDHILGTRLLEVLPPEALRLPSLNQCAELRPTDIARRFGIVFQTGQPDAVTVNRVLEHFGFQRRTKGELLNWTQPRKAGPSRRSRTYPKMSARAVPSDNCSGKTPCWKTRNLLRSWIALAVNGNCACKKKAGKPNWNCTNLCGREYRPQFTELIHRSFCNDTKLFHVCR